MSDGFRDFDRARSERQAATIGFRLGGREFTIPARIPAGALLDVTRAVAANNDFMAMTAFTEFLDALIPADQAEEFKAALREPEVDQTDVMDLIAWIVEESTGRPLQKRSSSAPPAVPDGAPSRVVSLSSKEIPSA